MRDPQEIAVQFSAVLSKLGLEDGALTSYLLATYREDADTASAAYRVAVHQVAELTPEQLGGIASSHSTLTRMGEAFAIDGTELPLTLQVAVECCEYLIVAALATN